MSRRALFLAMLCLLEGCTFVRLKRDVARINKTAYVSGSLSGELDPNAQVFLVHLVGEKKRAIQRLQPTLPEFDLLVKLGELNMVEAFQDLDGDSIYDPGEPCAFTHLEGLESVGRSALDLPPLILERDTVLPVTLDLRHVRKSQGGSLGEIVPLTDARYHDDRVYEGMWQPLKATARGDYGIHFLAPHVAGRVPVLFVHGINGSPRNFDKLIAHLDRTKFEPWVAYYPSGIRLPVLAQILAGLLQSAKETYSLDHVFIIAHSMGGLVARAAVQQLEEKGETKLVSGMVTLATPWAGHSTAAWALERAPEAVPSWIDIATGSQFVASLQKPVSAPLYVFFSYGPRSLRYLQNNDGVVSVSSQLERWAQDQAAELVGFDETHMGLLRSAEVEAKMWPLVR